MSYIGWRIWYGDGTIFDSRQGSWEDAPKENVQVIIAYQDPEVPKTRLAIRGRDYFDFDGQKFYKSDNISDLPGVSIKYGRGMSDDEFVRMLKKARATPWR